MFTSLRKTLATLARVCPVVVLLGLAAQPDRVGIRLLSATDMAEMTGDTPGGFCKKSFACNIGVEEGSICVYCEVDGKRLRCCADSKGTSCDESGGIKCFGGGKRWEIDQYTKGSCSCSASMFNQVGDCNTFRDADCTTDCK